METPPTKRLRVADPSPAFVDTFGDEGDFTQDDLDEIDIITSQAVTADRPTANQSRGNPLLRQTPVCPEGKGQCSMNRGDYLSLLELQHTEVRQKLKAVQEQMVLKDGEIKVLRDTMRRAQQEEEEQRQHQILQQQNKQKEHQDKEKELLKKIQSLQSELHFKEAEINDAKSKVQKNAASPLARCSPRVLGSSNQVHPGSSSSSSPTGSGFITKEMFAAQLPARITPVKTNESCVSRGRSGDPQEVLYTDPFLLSASPVPQTGVGLLSLLLQQYLSPSCLSLCRLLMSPPHTNLRSSVDLPATLEHQKQVQVHQDQDGISLIQNLAMTGLNMMTQKQSKTSALSGTRTIKRCCPGALHLLPLLQHHLKQLCQLLEALAPSPRSSGGVVPCGEESGLGPEETGLAALRVLHHLLVHSDEVAPQQRSPAGAGVGSGAGPGVGPGAEPGAGPGVGPAAQRNLLHWLLQLCDPGFCSVSQKKDILVQTALKTLCVLMERTPSTRTHRLQGVCWLQAVSVCVSADGDLWTVSECVCVLRCVSDQDLLAVQLCSHHESCVFLRLFHYIRTRPDPSATHRDWSLLDLQVIRLMSRLWTQKEKTWSSYVGANCPCNTEVVQTVVVMAHRQWLELRARQTGHGGTSAAGWGSGSRPGGRSPGPSGGSPWPGGGSPGLGVLREALLLLHWLLGNHRHFSESCRAVLHMYDQVVPAVRDLLRTVPTLSQSEELAVDEICRSETDDIDDMDT